MTGLKRKVQGNYSFQLKQYNGIAGEGFVSEPEEVNKGTEKRATRAERHVDYSERICSGEYLGITELKEISPKVFKEHRPKLAIRYHNVIDSGGFGSTDWRA